MNRLEQVIIEAAHAVQVLVLAGIRIHELRNQFFDDYSTRTVLNFVNLFVGLPFDSEQPPCYWRPT